MSQFHAILFRRLENWANNLLPSSSGLGVSLLDNTLHSPLPFIYRHIQTLVLLIFAQIREGRLDPLYKSC